MADFEAQVRAVLDTSQLESSLKSLENTQLKLKNFKADTSALKDSLQTAIDNTKFTLKIGTVEFSNAANIGKQLGSSVGASMSERISKQLDNGSIEAAIARVNAQYEKLGTTGNSRLGEIKTQIDQLSNLKSKIEIDIDQGQIEGAVSSYNEFNNTLATVKNSLSIVSSESQQFASSLQITTLDNKMQQWLNQNTTASEEYRAAVEKLKSQLSGFTSSDSPQLNTSQYQKIAEDFKKIESSAKAAGGANKSFASSLSGAVKQLTGFYSAIQVVRQGIQMMKDMAKEVVAVDTAMTGLYRVTDLTDAGYSKLYSNMVDSAKEYGATLSDIIDATTTWVKLGFEADVAQELGNVTTMYQHVADLDTDTAVKNLVTAYKGFEGQLLELTGGDSAAAVEYVADIFDKLNNEFAVTASGVGQGLTNCASALQVAGNSIQQSAAMLTGITEVTQNSSKAGAALRMLSMRLRGTTAKELEELGEDTEGVIEVTSKLQKTIKDLSGVDITDVNGQLRSTYDIMNDLASVWDELGANQQANVLETIAGKNRASDVAALIRNWDQVKAAFEASNNAWGTAANEQGIYIESIQGKMDQLKASWQAFANDFISSDFLKFGVDNLRGLVDALDVVVQNFGALGTISSGVLAFSVFKKGIPELALTMKTLDEVGWSAETVSAGFSQLGNSFMGFMKTPLGVATAIGAVTMAISAAVSAYQNYKQKQAEERQEKIDNAMATQREIDGLTNLYNEYYQAQAAYENGTGSKEAYNAATDALCQNLGIEAGQVAGLIEQYNGLDNALRNSTITKLNEEIAELTKGLEPAKEALVDFVDGEILGFGKKNEIFGSDGEIGEKLVDQLYNSGLISDLDYENSVGGYFNFTLGNNGAVDTVEDAIAIYDDANQMLNALEAGVKEGLYTREEMAASEMYNSLTSLVKDIEPLYEDYSNIVSSMNEDIARREILTAMNDQIPTTVADYKAFRQAMIDAAMGSNEFVGSQEGIVQAVDNALASMQAFKNIAKQVEQYDAVSAAFQQGAFGKGGSLSAAEDQYNQMMDWYNGLSDKEKELVYKVTISTPEASDFDLADWKKVLNSAVETASVDMSDIFSDDTFKEGLEKYQSDIDKLHEYRQKINEGTFTDEDAAAIIQLHPEFAEAEDFGAAIDQELETLIGTTYDREYKENVIVDLTPITSDGKVLSPEELEDYFNYLVDSGDILAADMDKEHGGLGIVVNIEPVTDDLDSAYKEAEKRTEELHKQQEQYYVDGNKDIAQEMANSVNGNVDMLARPQIEAAELVKKGWEDAGEGVATLFSSSFSAGDTSLFSGLKGFLNEWRSTLSEDQLPGFDKWSEYILNAAAAAEKGKTSIEQLSDAVAGVQNITTLFSDMQAFNATGEGDFVEMYQQVYALAQKAGGSVGDAIDMSTGRAKFNLEIINEWANSYYEAMYGIENVSDEQANGLIDWIAKTEEAAQKTEALSNAINSVESANDLLSKSKSGELGYLEMLQEVSKMAEQTNEEMGNFITEDFKLDEEYVKQWAESIVDGLDKYGFSDEEITQIKLKIGAEIEDKSAFDTLTDLMSDVDKASDLIKTSNKEVEKTGKNSYETIQSLMSLIGKDYKDYITEDGLVDVEKIAAHYKEKIQDGVEDEDLKLKMNAKIDGEVDASELKSNIDEAIGNLTKMQEALNKIRSGEGLTDEETFELYLEFPNLSEATDLESGLAAGVENAQNSLFGFIDTWAELNNVPASGVENIKEAIKGIGDTSENSAFALEQLTSALSRVSTLTDALSKAKSGDLGIIDMLETAAKLAEDSGEDITKYLKDNGAGGYELNEKQIRKDRIKAYQGMGLDAGTTRNVENIQKEEEAYDDLTRTMSKVEKASSLIKDANDEISTSGKNSLDTISSLMDLYGKDWAQYISEGANGEGIKIDTKAIKQNMLSEIDDIKDATPELKQSLKTSLDIEFDQETIKDNINEYTSNIETLQEALDKIKSGDFSAKDQFDLISQFPTLSGRVDDLDVAIKELITDMGTKIDNTFIEAIANAPTETARTNLINMYEAFKQMRAEMENAQIKIDISTETEGIENFYTAVSESASATGLSADSIKTLISRYKELSGYDMASLFSTSAHGVRLNTDALYELEDAYQKQQRAKIDDQIDSLVAQYKSLTAQINSTTDSETRLSLEMQRNKLSGQITELSLLSMQYDGLTSNYNKWLHAMETENAGGMYENITNNVKAMKELRKNGKVGTDEFKSFAQLLTNEDLTNASIAEIVAAFDSGIPKVDRYFTESSKGCKNFLKDLNKANEEWAHVNDNGEWEIKFNSEEWAKELGISTELVEMMLGELEDRGFKIKFDLDVENIQTDTIDEVQRKAQSAVDTLNELGKNDHEVKFNLKSTDVDDLNNQISEAQRIYNEFLEYDEEGNVIGINCEAEGFEEAEYLLTALIVSKQNLEKPAILEVDSSGADAGIQDAITKIEKFIQLKNQLELESSMGGEISPETTSGLKTAIQDLNNLSPEIKADLQLDTPEVTEALGNINESIELGVEPNPDDLQTVTSALQGIDLESLGLEIDTGTVQEELAAINEYTLDDKQLTVSLVDNASEQLSSIEEQVATLDGKTVTITTQVQTEGDPSGDGSTPEESSGSTVTIRYEPDYSAIEGSTPPNPPDGTVKFNADTSAVDAVQPAQKSGTVTFTVNDTAVQSYTAPAKTGKVTYTASMTNWTPPTKTGKVIYTPVMSGGAGVDGTAFAFGTASGKAFKSGNWGTKDEGTALGGELGRRFCDYIQRCMYQNLSNCWKTLKAIRPQRKDEICLSAMAAKAERIDCMVQG